MEKESESAIKHIIKVFDINESVATASLSHLSSLSNSDLEFLKKSWSDVDSGRRRQVILQLLQLAGTYLEYDFSRIFEFCLSDDDPQVRASAVSGLALEEDYLHVARFQRLMREDSSEEVRGAAIKALGTFAALGELGEIPDELTRDIYHDLLEVLDDSGKSFQLHCLALEAIAPLTMPRVKELIEKAYSRDTIMERVYAVRAMGRNCDKSWLPVLLKELGSGDKMMRREAAHALGEISSEEALPYLVKALADEDVQVVVAIAWALGQIGGEEARQALQKLAQHSEKPVRLAAKAAIEEINLCENPF